ncbi:hypothetical protein BaRGS_00014315 [Batillaria attramentaria]|uniref:Major facilitator superfamily (MFS) profile domain-containing protein n=1 Tax=Batillaria attramentaria TaxID=370345 RepID=A0ABD0L4F4_9CAEN
MEGGRWGLVIIASAFFIQVLAFGASGAIGVYNIEFLDYFDNNTVGVSLISAINFAMFLGSALVVLGIFLMPFLPYIPALCVCFGLLTGLGSCLVYLPSHVLSGLYYDRHRSLATGVATSGSGLGGALMPIVAGYLIQHYGWKGSLIVLSGLCLNLFVCAAVLRDTPKAPPVPVNQLSEAERLLKHGEDGDEKLSTQPELVEDDGPLELHLEVNRNCLELLTDGLSGAEAKGVAACGTQDLPGDGSVSERADHHSSKSSVTDSKQMHRDVELKGKISKSQGSVVFVEKPPKVLRHVYLFTDLGFSVYFASNMFWNITGAIMMTFGAEFIVENGFDPLDAAWAASISGFGCFLGGLLGGVLGNLLQAHRMLLYVVSNLMLGVCFVVLPFGSVYSQFVCIMFSSGLSFGVILGLLVVVLTDLVGPQNLADGMGYIMLANGAGCFIGPALTGYLRQVMGSYDSAFYCGGAFAFAAGIIMVVIPLLRPYCSDKSNTVTEFQL